MLAMLLFVGVTGAALAAVGELASHALQREKEVELLFIGDQYREAIASYYRHQQSYPPTLQDLLEDKRAPMPRRHLRKLWRDPVSGQPFATMDAPGGGIMGVYSPSEAEPVKSAGFLARDEAFTDATRYSEWKFVYVTPATATGKK